MTDCQHSEFQVAGRVNRLYNEGKEEIIGFSLDLKVRCIECYKPFQFLGLDRGYNPLAPRVSTFGQELRVPIAVAGNEDPDEDAE